MKKYISVYILSILLLPHLCFATPLDDKQNAESNAFFAGQVAERKAWMAAHQDIIAKLDQSGKALMAYKEGRRLQGLGRPVPGFSNVPPTPVVDDTYNAFVQKQQSDKEAFFQQLALERQNSLGGNSSTTGTTPIVTTPAATTPIVNTPTGTGTPSSGSNGPVTK